MTVTPMLLEKPFVCRRREDGINSNFEYFYFQLNLTNDTAQRVRVNALHTLTNCLCLVKELPRSDANVFPEYVLPSIAPLATDSSVMVRVAYAKNIGL